jgi:hypothetical protein
MKFLFFCGSLEHGRDGVGDYTRRLAGELIRQGHSTAIISLNDKFIEAVAREEQESEGVDIPVLRLPSGLSNKARYGNAERYIKYFDPEWLSLQFVPYSFQKKGLPFGLGKRLARIGKGRKWHVMFHELRVGMDKESSVKHLIIGKLQQWIIKNTVQRLRPLSVHTQSRLYQIQLEHLEIKVNILPLFGNIPVTSIRQKKIIDNNNNTSLVVFGGIQSNAPVCEFAKDLYDYQQNNKKHIKIIFIGRLGVELNTWINVLKKYPFNIKILGEQKTDRISEILSLSDWGISTTPVLQIEKSGCVAAMNEHHLPVLCVAREWTLRNDIPAINLPPYIREYKKNNLNLQFEEKLYSFSNSSLKHITQLFLNDL